MIKAKQLVYEFRRKFNRFNGGEKSDMDIVDIMSLLNEALEIYFNNLLRIAEVNSEIRNILRPLEEKEYKVSLVRKEKNYSVFEIPEKSHKEIRRRAVAKKGNCPAKDILIIMAQSDDLEPMRKNEYWKSSFEWEHVLADEGKEGLYLYHDGEMEIECVYLDFYCKPPEIHAPSMTEKGEYEDWCGVIQKVDKDLILDRVFDHIKIVDIAIVLAKMGCWRYRRNAGKNSTNNLYRKKIKMASFNRMNLIALCGNYPFVEAGIDLINCSKVKAGNLYNILAGQGAIYDPSTGKTLDAAGIATASSVSIVIGTGPENRSATGIRTIGGEGYDLCKFMIEAAVTPPQCGLPMVVDAYFGCIEPNETYALDVWLDDSYIRSTHGKNERAKYTLVADTTVTDCDECDPSVDCSELVCAFVDNANGVTTTDPNKVPRFYKRDNLKDNNYQPWGAARLFPGPDTSKTFCITLDDTDCEDCAEIAGITGVSIDGVETIFTGTTNPSDPTKSFPDQVAGIAEWINQCLYEVGGSAYLQRGLGKCCPYSIEVNTCAAEVLLLTAGAPIAPCATANPFEGINLASPKICKDCGDDPEPIEPTCGIRFFVDPIEVPCDCKLPPGDPMPNTYVRKIEVSQSGDCWAPGSFHTRVIQEPSVPEGFGYHWQWIDEMQHNGGRGRDYRQSNVGRGRFHQPDAASRSSNIAVKCEETYCVYNMVTMHSSLDQQPASRLTYTQKNLDYVLVPEKDAVTKADWELILNALKDRGLCSGEDLTCDSGDGKKKEAPKKVAKLAAPKKASVKKTAKKK